VNKGDIKPRSERIPEDSSIETFASSFKIIVGCKISKTGRDPSA
jgi:hypothetical protein